MRHPLLAKTTPFGWINRGLTYPKRFGIMVL